MLPAGAHTLPASRLAWTDNRWDRLQFCTHSTTLSLCPINLSALRSPQCPCFLGLHLSGSCAVLRVWAGALSELARFKQWPIIRPASGLVCPSAPWVPLHDSRGSRLALLPLMLCPQEGRGPGEEGRPAVYYTAKANY